MAEPEGARSSRGGAAGLTVLVTGATGGIGLAAARMLARQGALVAVGARDAARGQRVIDEIAATGGRAELFLADVSSLGALREAAARFAAAHPRLDVLVNNAGVAPWRRAETAEGHEITWATNVLAPFLLTRLLLPALRAARHPRVVNVGSEAYKSGRLRWDDLELSHGYGVWRAYAQSKLALLLATREQARREPGVAANVLHPGAIATGIWGGLPWIGRAIVDRLLPPPEKGAGPLVRLATDPGLAGVSGRYFFRYRDVEIEGAGRDDAAAARLWNVLEDTVA